MLGDKLYVLRYDNERTNKTYYYQAPGRFGMPGAFTEIHKATILTYPEAKRAQKTLGYSKYKIFRVE